VRAVEPTVDAPAARPFPLYVGGFLGPFGGAILAVLIPELEASLHASEAAVTAAIPAYLVPFAVLQLVSGTVGERLGTRRVVRIAYVAYAAFCLLAAVAPGIEVFLVARALQGAANAFLTPLLLAGLAEITPPHRLGRAVGTFAAVQTAAIAFSPLAGGAAAQIDWRVAFIVPAAVAVVLAAVPPPERTGAPRPRARFASVLTTRVGLLSAAGFAGYAGATGIGFLVALRADDAFGLEPSARGLLLASFGAAGMILGIPAGQAVDRYGRIRISVLGSLACAVTVTALGSVDDPWLLAALWFAAGAGSTLVWAGLNTEAVEAVPENRAGATSVFSAFKFAGNAAAPLLWVPIYHVDAGAAFVGAGIMTGAVAAFAMALPRVD
jgi:MFS family permease